MIRNYGLFAETGSYLNRFQISLARLGLSVACILFGCVALWYFARFNVARAEMFTYRAYVQNRRDAIASLGQNPGRKTLPMTREAFVAQKSEENPVYGWMTHWIPRFIGLFPAIGLSAGMVRTVTEKSLDELNAEAIKAIDFQYELMVLMVMAVVCTAIVMTVLTIQIDRHAYVDGRKSEIRYWAGLHHRWPFRRFPSLRSILSSKPGLAIQRTSPGWRWSIAAMAFSS